MRWKHYRPRTITEKHVSHNPSSFTPWSEAGFVFEELLPATAESILVTGNGASPFLRFLTAHVVAGTVVFASIDARTPFEGRLGRVWVVRAHPQFAPFRQMSFEYVMLVEPEAGELEESLKALMTVCSTLLVVFLTGKPDVAAKIADSLSGAATGITAGDWSVIRIPKLASA
jgi:hypothetical protein